ncbi:UDP-2 4-diacetamido-2 4 6-trideoxy-beta-L-altropyranose hydrolase [termite gut metagenome]|uniref:UDP-2 4-diacetamido-2 4 6-trideoxy-beta-L-altropyranose hydrolase n=1 Tax=termite gut metagenome TaxID=433724 RepID=A0A5J4R2L6_9ZZZZ
MKKILFRADASVDIGYGHFIRSLALADMLKENFDCCFVTVNPTEYQIQEIKKVCRYISLSESNHFNVFLSLLRGDEIVVLDNYFFATDYQREIKKRGCKLVCIDDIHDKHYVADVVINHGVDNPKLFSIEPYTRLCLGIEWVLLRKPFIEAPMKNRSKEYSSNTANIAISFGGVDQYRLTDKVIAMLHAKRNIERIDAIVGKEYQENTNYSSLSNVFFHRSVSAQEVADIFFYCDLAILSTSSICIEALVCRTFIAAGYYVDNQVYLYNYLVQNKLIRGLGCLLELEFSNINNIQKSKFDFSIIGKIANIASRYVECFKLLYYENSYI